MKQNSNGARLKWKVLLLLLGLTLMVGLIIVQQSRRTKETKQYEETIKQEEVQKQQVQKQEQKDIQMQEEEKNQGIEAYTEHEINPGASSEHTKEQEEEKVHITNLDEFAAEVMGKNTGLLEQRMKEWIVEQQIPAYSGTIFHVTVPQSDPQSINYYIRLNDERGSFVMLSYHPRENVVTASNCKYTEEEIKKEIWENNEPERTDVPPEEDTEYLQRQEGLDGTGGEN